MVAAFELELEGKKEGRTVKERLVTENIRLGKILLASKSQRQVEHRTLLRIESQDTFQCGTLQLRLEWSLASQLERERFEIPTEHDVVMMDTEEGPSTEIKLNGMRLMLRLLHAEMKVNNVDGSIYTIKVRLPKETETQSVLEAHATLPQTDSNLVAFWNQSTQELRIDSLSTIDGKMVDNTTGIDLGVYRHQDGSETEFIGHCLVPLQQLWNASSAIKTASPLLSENGTDIGKMYYELCDLKCEAKPRAHESVENDRMSEDTALLRFKFMLEHDVDEDEMESRNDGLGTCCWKANHKILQVVAPTKATSACAVLTVGPHVIVSPTWKLLQTSKQGIHPIEFRYILDELAFTEITSSGNNAKPFASTEAHLWDIGFFLYVFDTEDWTEVDLVFQWSAPGSIFWKAALKMPRLTPLFDSFVQNRKWGISSFTSISTPNSFYQQQKLLRAARICHE